MKLMSSQPYSWMRSWNAASPSVSSQLYCDRGVVAAPTTAIGAFGTACSQEQNEERNRSEQLRSDSVCGSPAGTMA